MTNRRIIFAGTPAFAVPTLEALLASRHTVVGVLTQPDRPAGRGRKQTPSPVKQLAEASHLPVFQPSTLKDPDLAGELEQMAVDVFVVVAYGLLLPAYMLDYPTYGCLNIHASLLPRWRGAAPIQRAIEAGDIETGICIMRMDKGLDTGNVLLKESISIEREQTAGDIHDQLARLGASLICQVVGNDELLSGVGEPQIDSQATQAKKLEKSEARLDWTQPADLLQRKILAFNPWPVADTRVDEQQLRIYRAVARSSAITDSSPGTVISESAEGIEIATGQGSLLITELQWPGGRVMNSSEFLNGRSLLGMRLA